MKKRILSLVLTAAVICTLFPGCASSPEPASSDNPAEPSVAAAASNNPSEDWKNQDITLTIIHSHTDEAVKSVLSSTAFDVAKQKFLEDYPNVHFEETAVADADYEALMLQYAAADTLPDLFWWSPGKSDTYVGGGLTADLTSYVDPSPYLDRLASSTFDGGIYGISMKCSDSGIVYYNESMLEEATGSTEFPTKLEDFLALADYCNEKGIDLISLGNKMQWPGSQLFASSIVRELCGQEWLDTFLAGKADLSNAGFAEALQWLQKIGAACNADFNAQDDGWAVARYCQGLSFCHVSGSWVTSTLAGYKDEYPDVINNTRAAIFPGISGEKNNTYLVSGMANIWSINSKIDPESPEFYACFEFLSNYICGEPYARYMAENGSTAPMSVSVDTSSFEPLVTSFLDVHNGGYPATVPINVYLEASVNSVWMAELQSLMAGTLSVDQFIADLQAAQNAL